MFTSTFVVCGFAHVFVEGEVVVVAVVEVTGGGVGGGGVTATPTTPFMPSLAWPGIVQRYSYLPFFIVSVSACDLPGASDLVTLPTQVFGFVVPIELEHTSKVWGIFPLFVTLKTTVPAGT